MLGVHLEREIREQPDIWRAIAESDKAERLAREIRDRDVVLLGSGSSLFMAQLGALALRLVGYAALNRTVGDNQGWNHAGNLAAALLAMGGLIGFRSVVSCSAIPS